MPVEPFNSTYVFIVDDDPCITQLADSVLRRAGYNTCTFNDPAEFLSMVDDGMHGCILLDMSMPNMMGLEVQRRLRDRGIVLPVVFLTGAAVVATAVEAMKHGALDLIQKPFETPTLLRAVDRALSVGREKVVELDHRRTISRRADQLSPRELEVGRLIARGYANKQVAIDLGISERTVEVHRSRVMSKMQAESLADLVLAFATVNDNRAAA